MTDFSLSFSDKAVAKITAFIAKKDQPEKTLLRISVPSAKSGEYNYQFFLDNLENLDKDSDFSFKEDSFSYVINQKDCEKLNTAHVDWLDNVSGSGFHIENPNKPHIDPNSKPEDKINTLFDDEINPSLASHGGSVELVEVKDNKAFVRFQGGCQGCSSSQATMKNGIEKRIFDLIPEITEVVDVTDHASGQNPYYS